MAESLQKLDSLKDEFVAHVSHELRTPLTSAKMSLANLLDGLAGPIDERHATVLHRIRGDLDRLIRMVNELLDVARLEAGHVELAPERVELKGLVENCLGQLGTLSEGREVQLTGEGLAQVDPGKFRQVVLNLLDNAFRHGRGRVEVNLRSGRMEVTSEGDPIPEDVRERLFQRFASGSPGGAGLGLAICRKLVELHGGKIEFRSAQGGNTFVVEMPCPLES
jgi:signal transduction histidine kinase